MKRIIITAMLGLLICAAWAEPLKVKFATGEWAPYTSATLPNKGSATEMVSAICKEADIIPEFVFYPWARSENLVKDGEAFAAFPYAITDERKVNYDFSDVLFYGVNIYFYYAPNEAIKDDVKKFTKIEDFKSYRFGMQIGSFLEPVLDKLGFNVSKTASNENLVKMLQAKRFDFLIDDKAVLYSEAKRLFPKEINNFKALDITYGEKKSGTNALLVSKKYPNAKEITKRFNEGLAKLKKSGEYDKIVAKNNLTK